MIRNKVKNVSRYNDEGLDERFVDIIIIILHDILGDIDYEILEEYRNSPEWMELDDLYRKILTDKENTKQILMKIVVFGEIAKAKFEDFFNQLEREDQEDIDLLFFPFVLRMPIPKAIDFLDRSYSENMLKSKHAEQELNTLIQDELIRAMIYDLEIALDNDHQEVINIMTRELTLFGEKALPIIKETLIYTENQEFEDKLSLILLTIMLGKKKAIKMSRKLDLKETPGDVHQNYLDLLNKIDSTSYFNRHPEMIEKRLKHKRMDL